MELNLILNLLGNFDSGRDIMESQNINWNFEAIVLTTQNLKNDPH